MDIVNDEYWLKYGKSSIEKSISSRNDAAAKLEKMTLWFWGLYTASFTIGVSINLIQASLWVLIMLASPIVLLILTYWFCILAQLPVNAEFDPTIPYEIKEAFNSGLAVKNRRFRMARILTLVSAIMLCSALFSLSFVEKKATYSVDVHYEDESSNLIISGFFPASAIIETNVDSTNAMGESTNFYSNQYKVQKNGILNLNIPLKSQPKLVDVLVVWEEKKIKKGLYRNLKK